MVGPTKNSGSWIDCGFMQCHLYIFERTFGEKNSNGVFRRPLSVGNSDVFPGNEELFDHTSPQTQKNVRRRC